MPGFVTSPVSNWKLPKWIITQRRAKTPCAEVQESSTISTNGNSKLAWSMESRVQSMRCKAQGCSAGMLECWKDGIMGQWRTAMTTVRLEDYLYPSFQYSLFLPAARCRLSSVVCPLSSDPMLHALCSFFILQSSFNNARVVGLGFAYQKFPKHLICLRQD